MPARLFPVALFASFLGLASILPAAPVHAGPESDSNVLLILDASNSMWGRIGRETKMDIARRVLRKAVADIDGRARLGLMLYGHRVAGDCGDVELAVPFGAGDATGSGDAAAVSAAIGGVKPRGKTPIAGALALAEGAFAGHEEEANSVLLVSDGLETCGGDPCAVAAQLRERGINLRVHVVGFDVDAAARAQLQCIADAGGGRYFDARDAGGLADAVAEIRQEIEKPAPPPPPPPPPAPEPKPQIWFQDEFDGPTLGGDWELVAPFEDDFGFQNGALVLVTADGVPAALSGGRNMLLLRRGHPAGDWRATLRIALVPRSFGEQLRLGLANEDGSGIFATLRMNTENYATTTATLDIGKSTGAEETGFSQPAGSFSDRNLRLRSDMWASRIDAVELGLERRGRKYRATLRFIPRPGVSDVPTDPIVTREVTSLKPLGKNFVILFGSQPSSYLPGNGEGVVELDRFTVVTGP